MDGSQSEPVEDADDAERDDDDQHWWHRGLRPAAETTEGAATTTSCFWCSETAEAGAAQHASRIDGVITRCGDPSCPCRELVGSSSCPACNLPQRHMRGYIAQCDNGHCWDRRPDDYRRSYSEG